MNSDSLRTFVTLSKLKNFTRTAERMYVAQSTVTNRIAELENETGQKLFVRKQGGVDLTDEGRLFLSYAERICELEESFIHEVNASARYSHKLRVGAINAVYESSLYPVLSRFFANNRDTSINITLGHSLDMLRMLQDDLLDVAFSYLPLKKTGFVNRHFTTDKLVLLASPACNRFKNGIRREELTQCEYLMCNFAFEDVGEFVRTLFPPRYVFRFEIDNSGKIIEYLKDGLGYSFLPQSMVTRELAEKQLEIIRPVDFSVPKIASHCVYRRGNETAERFVEQLVKGE